jgi:heme exporter protein B
LMLSLLLGTPILSLVGGLAAALTLGTNRGSVLLSILVFPMVVPVLIFATGAVSAAADGLSARAHLGLLAALLILALTLVPLAVTAALRLNIE